MLSPGYDPVKAAQVVVYFALKAGGKINVLKLAKLLYLSEREFMSRYDEPMFFDWLVSMPDGPVASITLNLINGNAEDDGWSSFVAPRNGYDIEPSKPFEITELDELSAADIEVLDVLWEKFGDFDKYRLRDWTHKPKNIPEWEDPNGGSVPIPHEKVFHLLGKSQSRLLSEQIEERRALSKSLRV